jgi:hypothetical protein
MTGETTRFHRERLARMLRDLEVSPASLFADRELAIVDDASGRRLTAPLGNQTLAEGLISAVKLAAAGLREGGR